MMEALEESLVTNSSERGVKTTSNEFNIGAETSTQMDVCHTSNGLTNFAVPDDVGVKDEQDTESVVETIVNKDVDDLVTKFEEDYNNMTEAMETAVGEVSSAETENPMYVSEVTENEICTEIQEAESTGGESIDGNIVIETEVVEESIVEVDGIVDNNAGNITFETEIFIENNDSELDDETAISNEPDSSNILNELGQNIELSEVLRSSDVSETVENNNCEQEVFNKEELLDILEGNDVEESRKMISENFHADSKKLEEHLAMQQLNRLKSNDSKKKNRVSPKKQEKKQPKRRTSNCLPRETRAKVEETASSKSPFKDAKGKADETAGSKMSPKEAKGKVTDTASSKMSVKEAKGKVDDTASAKMTPKEAKGKLDETVNSKMTPKEVKGKVDDTASSKISLKETKGKVDDTASPKAPKETKGKMDDTASSKFHKEVKGKVNDSVCSKISPKEAKGKADDMLSSKIASKGKEENTATSKIALKDSKGKAEESISSKMSLKEDKVKVNDIASSNNISKEEGKAKIDEMDTSNNATKEAKSRVDDKSTTRNATKTAKANEMPKKDSIVNALVQDWSDDENMEPDESSTLLNESEVLLESTEDLAKSQESVVQEENILDECQEDDIIENNADVSVSDEITPNSKSGDEAQPQRRLGRVIKKKVIYDPDNPDTFTKTKVHIKKEKEVLPEKDQSVPPTPKKMKIDHPTQVPKTKSPVSKMQWKKPQPKNIKQSSKRLTEIDRLLMDEGAVNMICQLTPEALKGNKNMKSRAEFIKNIQSNTPDTKEMKFRERKSKSKCEDEPRKPGSGKHRLSMSSSVKSPAVSEDFENHSADDSIIYRRHSSSSYSSSCMSPRRLSDVDGGANQLANRETNEPPKEVFIAEKISTPKREIMNKSDCLSIKEKLNSKLSQALNKRKLAGIKSEKPSKIKKVIPTLQNEEVSTDVTVNLNQKVAEICIHKGGTLFNVQIMKVLENVLSLVDSNSDITVTLITSDSGSICSGLDLSPILSNDKSAYEIAEHARSLMSKLESHSKFLIVGVEGKTQGFSLALTALSDLLLASENASFAFSKSSNAVLYPGAGVLTSKALPQKLVNDLIVFGKEVTAAEALQGGLASRLIWPERFQEQVRAIAQDIAHQPFANITLKKQLLHLKKTGSDATFQTCLEKERDLLVNHWTSENGMQLLRANLDSA